MDNEDYREAWRNQLRIESNTVHYIRGSRSKKTLCGKKRKRVKVVIFRPGSPIRQIGKDEHICVICAVR